jgi:hypothetical protein
VALAPDIKKDKWYTVVHCEKVANVINCDCSDKIGLVEAKSGESAMCVRESWTVMALSQGAGK